MLFHSDGRARVCHRQGMGCHPPSGGRGGGRCWLALAVLDGTPNFQCYTRLFRDMQNYATPHTAHWHNCFCGTTGCGGHGLASSVSRHETHSACLEPNGVWIPDMDDHHSTMLPLRRAVLQAWFTVCPRRVRTLVESTPRHMHALLADKEGTQAVNGVVIHCKHV